MRKIYLSLILLLVLAANSGCQSNKTRIGEGAGIGGVVGAIAGGVIGHQGGHGAEGAVIGGALGAAGGAAVGSQIEKPNQENLTAAKANNTQPTMTEIVNLTKNGVSSDEIIAKIKAANSKYSLTAEDLGYLRKEGVSQRVIEAMQGL